LGKKGCFDPKPQKANAFMINGGPIPAPVRHLFKIMRSENDQHLMLILL